MRSDRGRGSPDSKKEPLRDVLYERMHACLIAGDYPPGDILVEHAVARSFGVSKSPAREAMQRLADEGFLKVIPRSGYLVCPVTADRLVETVHLRQLLEGETARLAASRITPDELDALREVQQQEEAGGDVVRWNRDFHLIIARAAGNRMMTGIIRGLLDQAERALRLHPHMLNPRASRAHWDIVEALEKRDPDRARAAMEEHVGQLTLRSDLEHEKSNLTLACRVRDG